MREHYTSPAQLNTWLELYQLKDKLSALPNERDAICADLHVSHLTLFNDPTHL
jgi:hypothetical protein